MKRSDTNFFQTEGIILKRKSYRENSLLCRCITADLGVISLIANGVQKEKSPLTGCLEPFSQLQLELYRSPRSEIYNLRAATMLKSYQKDLTYRECLLINAAAELLLQCDLVMGETNDYYSLLCEYLKYLSSSKYHPFLIFLRFVNRLLSYLGISLEIECIRCQSKDIGFFYPQEEGFLCRECYRPALSDNLLWLESNSVNLLQNLFNLQSVIDEQLGKETVEQIKSIILIHLSNHYNKPFHLHSLNDYK